MMKQRTILTLLMALLVTLALRANAVEKEVSVEKVKAFELRIVDISGSFGSGKSIREYAISNDIPHEVYIATVEKAAEGLMSETIVYTNDSGKVSLELRSGSQLCKLVNIMGNLGDREFLPWLEKQATESQWISVRERASIAYVKIAGLDAVPLVQKILSGSEEKYDIGCKRVVAKEFFEQVAKAEASKAPQAKIDAAYKMLIEQAQSVSYVGHADQIDRFLSERLEGYRASTQRQRVVDRFINSTNEFARANFRKKQEELQKTPKADHADLSKRFPGLAEVKLEDAKQTEAPSSAEDK